MVKALAKRLLHRLGYTAFPSSKHYAEDGLYSLHDPRFLQDERFARAYARGVQANQGHDPGLAWRTHIAIWAASTALRVEGDFVECGVNAGFLSSAILSSLPEPRRYFLIDTFAGPVLSQYSAAERASGRARFAEEAAARGAYVTDLDRVRANFAQWPHAVVVQGAVPEVLPSIDCDRVAFLHLDLNCAAPEIAALDYFWNKMPRGAVILLDDYAYLGHSAQGDAAGAWLQDHHAELLTLPTGQALILR